MVFIGLHAGRLCAAIKDPKATGGRDLPAMLEHVANDSWSAGAGTRAWAARRCRSRAREFVAALPHLDGRGRALPVALTSALIPGRR